jgi:hypothetical protein
MDMRKYEFEIAKAFLKMASGRDKKHLITGLRRIAEKLP